MSGHLFVVRGLLESVRHDVTIIPTASDFHLRAYWKPVLGGSLSGHEPTGWRTDCPPFARSAHPGFSRTWFLNVGRRGRGGTAEIVGRVEELMRAVAQQVVSSEIGRSRPLVVLPVPGIGGGNMGGHRGDVVRQLVPALERVVSEHDLDVALVIKDASVHAATQHVRRSMASSALTEELQRSAAELARQIRDGKLALFFGAGVSVGAGLPTWKGLLEQLAERLSIAEGSLDDLSSQDQAQVIEMRSQKLGESVSELIGKHTTPALSHALLASFDCREAVTTNYDRLYETAVRATGSGVASVLPWESIGPEGRWVLKMHGDVENTNSIVLTRSDFVRYDTLARPAGALLQAMLLTKHVLIVGASMTDDNVVRLAYEVNEYRRQSGRDEAYGTLIDVGTTSPMRELWEGQLSWLSMPGDSQEERTRNLDIFLDAVSLRASTDAPWLLDERFVDMLGGDKIIAERARRLFADLPDDPQWAPLRSAMLKLGVTGSSDDGMATATSGGDPTGRRPLRDRRR